MKYILFSLCAKIQTVLIYSFSGRIASGNREKKRFFIKMIFTDTHFHLCEDIPLPDYITEAQKENVQKFLAEHEDFVLEDFPHPLTGERTGGMMRVVPSETLDCDGSFCARLRRKK